MMMSKVAGRLSRPCLSQRFPLPLPAKQSALHFDPNAALDLEPNETDDHFLLNPVLTLPPAFGSTYVGETFSCTLCANNELPADSERQVTSVRVGAEMQAPSGATTLEVSPADQEAAKVSPGESLQKIVRFELREEGAHTLAVNLSYSETTVSKDQSASSGRIRTFRKLYQFVARPCLGVRTKVSNLQSGDSDDTQSQATRYALEAQLESFADGTITLETATFNPKPAFKSTSLNWDAKKLDMHHSDKPCMAPRDVLQIAFLVEQRKDGPAKEVTKDDRTLLGNLDIQWTTVMGERGFLSTGWLTTKKR
ncbi:MAG: hypothetical protein ASARMPREDX12_005306 [Alectoria sarmentosa]|nr:MAG: hypothetical protein ASARMPREDX12_005306 [Alectoria sarmentosa]